MHESGRAEDAEEAQHLKARYLLHIEYTGKKKYITREIDAKDRRKVSISATPEGKAAAEQSKKKFDELWDEILTRFGEDNMRELLRLMRDLDELYATLCNEK